MPRARLRSAILLMVAFASALTHGGTGRRMLSQLASAGVACCRSLAAKMEIPVITNRNQGSDRGR